MEDIFVLQRHMMICLCKDFSDHFSFHTERKILKTFGLEILITDLIQMNSLS